MTTAGSGPDWYRVTKIATDGCPDCVADVYLEFCYATRETCFFVEHTPGCATWTQAQTQATSTPTTAPARRRC